MFALGCAKLKPTIVPKFLVSPWKPIIHCVRLEQFWKQLVSANKAVCVSAAPVFSQFGDRCRRWRTVLVLGAAAEHLEVGCMACPGWHACHDYSAPWSSARCSSTLTQVCLEYPAAAAVVYLRPEPDPSVPVRDEQSICGDVRSPSSSVNMSRHLVWHLNFSFSQHSKTIQARRYCKKYFLHCC